MLLDLSEDSYNLTEIMTRKTHKYFKKGKVVSTIADELSDEKYYTVSEFNQLTNEITVFEITNCTFNESLLLYTYTEEVPYSTIILENDVDLIFDVFQVERIRGQVESFIYNCFNYKKSVEEDINV
jgi:hypothetical protein